MAIKAKLTTFDTTMIVVSIVIGIGIFRVPAMVAGATQTRFLFLLAWGLGGVVSLCGALTFAEIGARFPRPGAFYKVVAECFHSSLAFMLNWTSVLLVNGAGTAAVAIIGAEYLNPIILPPGSRTQGTVLATATLMVLSLYVVNLLGIKTSAWALNALTLAKVGMIAVLVYAAFRFVGQPLGPQAPALELTSRLLQGAGLPAASVPAPAAHSWWLALALGFIPVFYTYGGYQIAINFGADVKNASRNMPRAILAGIAIILSCYVLINIAYSRVLSVPRLAEEKLVAARVAETVFGPAGSLFVSLIIFISAMGFLNVNLMQNPRAYFAMAEDRALPALFGKVNKRTQTQEFALSFFCGSIFLSLYLLGSFENIVTAVMFIEGLHVATAAATIFVLRHRCDPGQEYSGYRAPLYPLLPLVFIAFLLSISANILLTQPRLALIGTFLLLSGLPLFLLMRWVNRRKG